MFLLKLLMKILLLPVMLVLFGLRVLVKVGIELSSIVIGGLILIIFGCIIYAIVQQMWPSMWILIAMCFLYYRSNDKPVYFSYDLYRNLRKERITDMMHRNVLSSSYVLYLSLLLDSGKVHFACENTPVKQRHP